MGAELSLVDALGWFGSALLVFSLLQARILRLRILSTIACGIFTGFNAILGGWPMVAMNIVLAATAMPAAESDWSSYQERLGFRRDGHAWALDIAGVTRPEGDR